MTKQVQLRPRRRTAAVLAAAGSILAAAVAGSPGVSSARPVTTPLADGALFISPCGKPYRSKPGEPYPVVAWFKAVDANHDGRIDRAEFHAEAEAFFHELDRSGAGVVTDQDIDHYEAAIVPEINAAPQDTDEPLKQTDDDGHTIKLRESDGPLQGAAAYDMLGDPEPVRSADRSFEGRITLSDFLARADHNFDELDPNGRGYLTLDDLPQTPVEQHADAKGRW